MNSKYEQGDSKFMWRCKGPRIANDILKKNKARGMISLKFIIKVQ